MALSDIHVQRAINALNEGLRNTEDTELRKQLVTDHLKKVESDSKYDIDAEFPPNLTWFNVSNKGGLNLSDQLKGKIVILDFFTYCCINCLHILPDLHNLETRYKPENGVVIVGVHSAKFPNEKSHENIKNAILKNDITHAVVNDANIELWERLAVSCWPTLVFISPEGRLIHYIIGEGHTDELNIFIDIAHAYYSNSDRLASNAIGISLERDKAIACQLSFPGKIAVNQTHLFVADSGNHRLLMINRKSHTVEIIFGQGKPGLQDGRHDSAMFRSPQGIVYYEGQLFVADTENHCIRKIDISSLEVSTVVGTGRQGNDKEGGAKGRDQEISSPWDIALISGPESDKCNILCIANAGTHQLWAYFLEDSKWFKGSNHTHLTVVRMCGSGDEVNRNNTFPHKASFAQPSGLTVDHKAHTIYVADSESSTIRCVSAQNGSVKGLIGGGLDPMDLFAFGDHDGKGRNVRLQHPLGVVWDCHKSMLYIADSYNHKIKVCNPVTKTCSTLVGTGQSGMKNGGLLEALFNEPGGICVTDEGKTLFVTDTNNHCIRRIDVEKETVENYDIIFQEDYDSTDSPSVTGPYTSIVGKRAKHVTHPHVINVPTGGEFININLKVMMTEGYVLNQEQDSLWQMSPQLDICFESSCVKGCLNQSNNTIQLRFRLLSEAGSVNLQVELVLYYCSVTDSVCLMHQALLTIPIQTMSVATSVNHDIHYTVQSDASS